VIIKVVLLTTTVSGFLAIETVVAIIVFKVVFYTDNA
jgi:hypothetical protein